MSNERMKYRNPAPPLGYEKKVSTLIVKKPDYGENINIHTVIQMILDSKICEEPDVSIYEDFSINPGSDEEEVLEIPFVPVPKVVDVLDITENDTNCESLTDTLIKCKEERLSPAKDSASPVQNKVGTETGCHESFVEDKKPEKQDEVTKKKHRKKRKSKSRSKHKKKYNFYDRDDDSHSTESGDSYSSNTKQYVKSKRHSSNSDSRSSPLKMKDNYGSDSNSKSRSQYKKKKNHGSDIRSRYEKKVNFSSDSDSRSKSQYKKKRNYSNSDAHSSRYKKNENKKENYDSDSDSHSRSRYKKKEIYSSDSDSHSRSRYKKRENYSSSDSDSRSRSRFKRRRDSSSDSDSHRSHKKGENYKESHSYKELNDSDSNVSDKSQTNQLSCFKSDDSKIKPKTEYTFVRIDKKRYTSSPSTLTEKSAKEQENSINIKIEESVLYGDFRCQVCQKPCNNPTTYESHLKGKKHKKAVEMAENEALAKEAKKNAVLLSQGQQATSQPLVPLPTLPLSKYPAPPSGYHRIKLNVLSEIQGQLNDNIKFPCPGLERVTEIWTPTERTYYCLFCDSNIGYNCIIPHLRGFKHQLNCLKHYRKDLYDQWSYKPKYVIEGKVFGVLKKQEEEERESGRSVIRVEKDVKDRDNINVTSMADFRDRPSTSTQSQDLDYFENYLAHSRPDPTKSGFYCEMCKSPCNSQSAWDAHITGKKHLANLKKKPGAAPSKSKYTPAGPNVRPYLFEIIKAENEYNSPVVGLQQIREIQKPDIKGYNFHCFLCGAFLPASDILSHILSSKHREKYLNDINHPEMETLKNCVISESSKSSILEDICARVEAEVGSGRPDVFYAKNCSKSPADINFN